MCAYKIYNCHINPNYVYFLRYMMQRARVTN